MSRLLLILLLASSAHAVPKPAPSPSPLPKPKDTFCQLEIPANPKAASIVRKMRNDAGCPKK